MRRWLVALLLLAAPVAARPARADAVDHYHQGLLLLQQQEYRTALDEFRIAVVDQPTNPEALCGMGMALYKLNNLQEASEAFDKALAITSSAQVQAQARSGLGDIYLQLGEHALAVPQYRRALGQYPLWAGARLSLIRCLLALHQWDAATSELDRLQHDRPKLAEAFQLRSQLALIRGDLPGAHRAGIHAWTLSPSLGESALAQSCALACQLGDYPAAARILAQYQGVRTATYWTAAGDVWSQWLLQIGPKMALGQDLPLSWRADPQWLRQEAVAAYQRSLLHEPNQPAVRRDLAVLARMEARPVATLLTAPGMAGQTGRQDGHASAAAALAAGQRELAVHLSEQAARGGSSEDAAQHVALLGAVGEPVTPGWFASARASARGRFALGWQAWQAGHSVRAEQHWQSLPAGVWQELSLAIRAQGRQEPEQAWQHLHAAAQADPLEPQVYALAGLWHLQEGDLAGALKAWQWGNQVGVPDPLMLAGLGRLYDELGQGGEARACWRRLLTIQPAHGDGFTAFWRGLQQAPWRPRPEPTDHPAESPVRSAKA
jgi:tetratricopeptide (TPR) repeat protein